MLHKPMSHGLAAEIAYTWSRLYDDMDDSGWGEQPAPRTIRTLIILRPTMHPRILTGQTPSRGRLSMRCRSEKDTNT